ncbi:MAG: twin-arginine translocation signal domain-containing protein, partial [Sedimentisphaerales bacterium]|nr:twin-arginine translocation signal domain-containing protein [Sedimentisphaerales bacterium]
MPMFRSNIAGQNHRPRKIDRRGFLTKTTAAAGALGAFTMATRSVLGGAGHNTPNENVAGDGQRHGRTLDLSKDNLFASNSP